MYLSLIPVREKRRIPMADMSKVGITIPHSKGGLYVNGLGSSGDYTGYVVDKSGRKIGNPRTLSRQESEVVNNTPR
ncbi:hypothetical protein A2392_01960 [Candidatus Kaiserbacteria bacterium RIFOXYB1_FULL_46_14]|uniref:Uncharacterized protein n=1 Tax=Candidatus Kaiserbacteria bacterium RIFOXYB1_FULL_46_14 TaxID=1798531 RepID=A0A1F6FK46_9BACT|nr:MAG: hypothetical protein A2392_01960 [Candidatus Kaiserbacteria bacterium RIFOXYB1_FULL_46_14]